MPSETDSSCARRDSGALRTGLLSALLPRITAGMVPTSKATPPEAGSSARTMSLAVPEQWLLSAVLPLPLG